MFLVLCANSPQRYSIFDVNKHLSQRNTEKILYIFLTTALEAKYEIKLHTFTRTYSSLYNGYALLFIQLIQRINYSVYHTLTMSKFHLLALALFAFCTIFAQSGFETKALKNDIKTLQLLTNDNFEQPPLLALNSDQFITIRFDELSSDLKWYSYRILHCDADWKPSTISEMEYLDGFNGNPIEEAYPSFNTFVNYYHYKLTLPNDRVNFRISGNYTVLIYEDTAIDQPVATACFSVVDQKMSVKTVVTSNTDIDFNQKHQQLSIHLGWNQLHLSNPTAELKVKVQQNNRRDNEVTITTPTRFGNREAIYEHNRQLIFEAGNNYRRFEMVNNKYPGVGVENIRYFDPLYHVALTTDYSKSNQNYTYDRHQNGRFIIRESNAYDHHTEADYFMVHFSLKYAQPLLGGELFLSGEFTHDCFNAEHQMIYHSDRKQYENSMLLKQGHYNYQYLFLPNGKRKAESDLIEGNYFETANEYLIKVYYRPIGSRYDQLIGVSLVK